MNKSIEKIHTALIDIEDSGSNSLKAVMLMSVCYNLRASQKWLHVIHTPCTEIMDHTASIWHTS